MVQHILYSTLKLKKFKLYCNSTRVANELGAGKPERAKNAMAVSLKLSSVLALAIVLALVFGHNIWAGFFSDSSAIIKKFASMTTLFAVSIALDCVQGVLSGWELPQFRSLFGFLGSFVYISLLILMEVSLVMQEWPEDVVGSK